MKVDASILTVLIFIGAGASAGYVIKSGIVYVPVLTDMSRNAREESVANHAWPPVIGQPYPELQLTGLDGKPVKLSDYKGRVMVIESIAMSCKACQSFSGANEEGIGPFATEQGGGHQPGLESFETYLNRFAKADLNDPRLLYVQVLFYGLESRPPTLEEAQAWASHFKLDRPNVLVAIASDRYISQETQQMIPSFQLVDQNFQLRFDAGKQPRQDLYKELLPGLTSILAGETEPEASAPTADTPAGSAEQPEAAPASAG
ncbi:MAG: redoxin domain-containing protein [Planctomycetales bacterium]|nr:redoxin domain-containing protein [Planctomycetales bacterium]